MPETTTPQRREPVRSAEPVPPAHPGVPHPELPPRISFRDSLGTVTCVAVCFAIAAYVLSYACSGFWLAELFTHFRIQLLGVFALLGLLLAFLRYGRWAVLVAACMAWLAWPVMRDILPASVPAGGPTRVKLLAANVLFYNENFEPLERLVAAEQPDVLVIVECTLAWRERLRGLEATYPYSIAEPRSHGFGIGLWSKRPLLDPRAVLLSNGDAPVLFAGLEVDGQAVQIAAVHLLSPLDPGRFAERNTQLSALTEALNRWSGPRLVVGDFNATPWSPFLTQFLRESGLRDSRVGFGIQASWPQQIPLLRIPIDHLFVSPELVVHDRRLGPPINSDHRPVIAEISRRAND